MGRLFDLLKKRVLIIAEIGCNHNGDMLLAKKLIESAANAGADVAKFQSFNPEDMMTVTAPKAAYQIKATGTKESQYKRLLRLKLTRKQHKELKVICDKNNIIFCSSPFDYKSARMLYEMKVPFFKVPSGEITNLPLLKQLGSFKKPIILSTGMANLREIGDALNAIGKEHRKDVILMHCVSVYPSKWEEANLRAIQTLKQAFKVPVGFSDHSEGIELSLVGIGLGASVIEKHITLDKNMEGGDHKASLEPHEFKELVNKIRHLEFALGNGIKRCMPSEENIRDVARKSIVACRDIKRGEIINKNLLTLKRPGTGIPPKYFEKVIGSRAKSDITSDHLIRWSQIDMRDK